VLDHIRKLYDRGGLDAVWDWCMEGDGALRKSKRFEAAATWARKKKNAQETPHDEKEWGDKQEIYHKESRKWFKKHKRRQDVEWPESCQVAELLYHDPPHFHFATPERDKLIRIAKIGQEKYHCRIGEFPPFDPVEAVHVSGSWHYRDSSNPWTPRNFSNRGDGLAFDANDLDGGNDQEFEFYAEVRDRYA
jgi:hypothetical protein